MLKQEIEKVLMDQMKTLKEVKKRGNESMMNTSVELEQNTHVIAQL